MHEPPPLVASPRRVTLRTARRSRATLRNNLDKALAQLPPADAQRVTQYMTYGSPSGGLVMRAHWLAAKGLGAAAIKAELQQWVKSAGVLIGVLVRTITQIRDGGRLAAAEQKLCGLVGAVFNKAERAGKSVVSIVDNCKIDPTYGDRTKAGVGFVDAENAVGSTIAKLVAKIVKDGKKRVDFNLAHDKTSAYKFDRVLARARWVRCACAVCARVV